MTVIEMIYNFGIQLGRAHDISGATIQTDDRLYWLNQAQLEFVRKRLSNQNLTFEQGQQAKDDMRILIISNYHIPTVQVLDTNASASLLQGISADKAVLPSDCMFMLTSRSVVRSLASQGSVSSRVSVENNARVLTGDDIVINVSPNRLVTHDQMYEMLQDPFWKTSVFNPLCSQRGNELHVYTTDEFVVSSVKVDYIKPPREMQLDPLTNCELPDFLHDEIVSMAATLFAANTSTPQTRGGSPAGGN